MLRVALATENNPLDGALLLDLMGKLGITAEPWSTSLRPFSGWQGIFKHLPTYLAQAARDGVRHALVAVDNDGGSVRHPPHEPSHDVAQQAADLRDGCRTCRMLDRIPRAWSAPAGAVVVVVPVQAMETWLLALQDYAFTNPVPENNYDRRSLKKRFWADALPGNDAARLAFARQALTRADLLEVLRRRPSFLSFADAVSAWKR